MKRQFKKITVGDVVNQFLINLELSKKEEWVRKPFSYALYRTWQWCDCYEQPRPVVIIDEFIGEKENR